MVHVQQVQEAMAKRKSSDVKRERSYDGGSSKGRLDIQDKPRSKKKVSNHVHSNILKDRDDRVSNPKIKKGRYTSSPTKNPNCEMCGNKHYIYCLR